MSAKRENQDSGWVDRKLHERGKRALERQLDYQEAKAVALLSVEDDLVRTNFVRSQVVRQKIESVRTISKDDKILEVGSGAHGLVFGIATGFGVGLDPLAVDYKKLFPKIQRTAPTIAAVGEQLPFHDATFDIVLSDNVIDHATSPLTVVDEIIRVLKPGGTLYFTVNVHHPFYDVASRVHGAWNALGLKFELSAFADHTIHLTERRIMEVFAKLPLKIANQSSTVTATKYTQRTAKLSSADSLLKKIFFKNAIYELVAEKEKPAES